jgi:hypothetical protein
MLVANRLLIQLERRGDLGDRQELVGVEHRPDPICAAPLVVRTCVRMTTYTYRLVEYNADRAWIVLANEQHTVDLPDDQDFGQWAREQYPGDRFRVIPESPIEPWPAA